MNVIRGWVAERASDRDLVDDGRLCWANLGMGWDVAVFVDLPCGTVVQYPMKMAILGVYPN